MEAQRQAKQEARVKSRVRVEAMRRLLQEYPKEMHPSVLRSLAQVL